MKRAIVLRSKVEAIEEELESIFGATGLAKVTTGKKRGRKPGRKMSAKARSAASIAAKARWAKVKASGRTHL